MKKRQSGGGSGESRIPSLDGLRAISIGLVLLAHTSGTRFFPSITHYRNSMGYFGVRIFFVISGFLITTLLLKELAKTGRISLKWFYIRRLFRIFPPAYTYMLVMTGLTLGGIVGLGRMDLAHAFTYTVNYQAVRPWLTIHLWSLSVEEQFYLIWPAVLFLAGRRAGLWIAASMILVAPLQAAAMAHWFPEVPWVGKSFQGNMDALAVGCVLAGIREKLHGLRWYGAFQTSPVFLIVPAVMVAGGVADIPMGVTALNISIGLFIDRYVRFHTGPFGRLLNWGPVAYIGMLSYSIYLWQEPFLNRESMQPFCWFPLNLICAGAAAVASYYLVERPFLRLRKKLERREQTAAAVAA